MDATALSRAMSHALRHEPQRYGLTLDAEGWVPVDDLLSGLAARGLDASRADVEEVVRTAAKQRHEIDGDRVRARYGHSVAERVELAVGTPPPVLFHGTTAASAVAIRREGLRPMGRQYVHLSPASSTARVVGGRRAAQPVIFTVDTVAAVAAGVVFRRGNDDTWLADAVPPEFLTEP